MRATHWGLWAVLGLGLSSCGGATMSAEEYFEPEAVQDAEVTLTNGYLPWEAPGITGGFIHGDAFTVIRRDRFWKLSLSTKALLDSGMLSARAPFNQAQPIDGRYPWTGLGVTGVWTSGGQVALISKDVYWNLNPATGVLSAPGRFADLPPGHLFKVAGPVKCHQPWEGAGFTGGYEYPTGTFTSVSKDRFWTQNLTTKQVLAKGRFQDLPAGNVWKAAPKVGGQSPWEGAGITATWLSGTNLGVSSGDRYWTLNLATNAWVGSGFYADLPANHLFKQSVTAIAAASTCTAGQRRCSGNTTQVCTKDRQWDTFLICPATSVCTAGACVNVSGRFGEPELFALTSPATQLHSTFSQNHKARTPGGTLPPGASFDAATKKLTFTQKGGVVIALPAARGALYRVDVDIDDASTAQTGFATLIDTLWQDGVTTQGLSAGIDSASSAQTYWYTHTQLVGSSPYQSRFVRRRAGTIPVRLHVTPIGTYPVIDGANFSTLPDLTSGKYVFDAYVTQPAAKPVYLVLGKWDTGGNPVSFRNVRVVKLDESVAGVADANAHFLKRTLESGALADLISDASSYNGTGGYQTALWLAFAYRGYDFYFGTDHTAKIRQLVDVYLTHLPGDVQANAARFGCADHPESGTTVNHDFINRSQAHPTVFWAVKDRLTAAQLSAAQPHFAATVDAVTSALNTQGLFPASTTGACQVPVWENGQLVWVGVSACRCSYKGDTYAEEVSWIMSYLVGYYANFKDTDATRKARIEDWLKFLGYHHLSDGRTIREVAPGTTLSTLPAPTAGSVAWLDFRSRYTWGTPGSPSTYFVDNHDFHPSLNYAIGVTGTASHTLNILRKVNPGVLPTLQPAVGFNLSAAANTSVLSKLDLTRARNKSVHPVVTYNYPNAEQCLATTTVASDVYQMDATNSYVVNFVGRTNPSRLEDWGRVSPVYSVVESMAGNGLTAYATADSFAKNVYYLHHSGSGVLFCDHDFTDGTGCSMASNNMYAFLFGDALYAMLMSPRSTFR